METRILGRTGLEVSLIGFGGIPIQRCNQWEVDEIVENLIEEGVNFIDTPKDVYLCNVFRVHTRRA